MGGNTLVEFVVVFPFFCLLFLGGVDIARLSLARISLQRDCWQASKSYAASGTFPSLSEYEVVVAIEDLPSSPSRHVFRPIKKNQLVSVQLTKEIPLRFPLLGWVLQRKAIPLSAISVSLRVVRE